MDFILFFDITVQAIAFLLVFYMLYKKDEVDRDRTSALIESTHAYFESSANKFMESLTKLEIKHFEQLEKQSSKQFSVFTDLVAAMQPKSVSPYPVPDLLDNNKIENSIEKEEPKDYFLDEIGRIPNINDMKVKFIDEEHILGDKLDD